MAFRSARFAAALIDLTVPFQPIVTSLLFYLANARLSGEQRYHNTQLLRRKHKSRIKPKPPSVANPP
ncbi:hypothetical protein D0263_00835 [Vibrio parahaemolyticus]|nr:hypothetical protein [Vibrio parahaemolyticus]EGR1757014.1 hypothetical protein [Vibrio parahaemolyticus]EGR2226681.1 hypothetical protein [Vibrio parahaemolyticus]EGR2346345.1 hypothetical protein [Vibrio parahaemolyticus]